MSVNVFRAIIPKKKNMQSRSQQASMLFMSAGTAETVVANYIPKTLVFVEYANYLIE